MLEYGWESNPEVLHVQKWVVFGGDLNFAVKEPK